MVSYEVELEVERDVARAFASWLPVHIRAMLSLDGFTGASWLEPIIEEGEAEGDTLRWIVRYELRDQAALDTYLEEHAARLRADGVARFGRAFKSTRQVFVRREHFSAQP